MILTHWNNKAVYSSAWRNNKTWPLAVLGALGLAVLIAASAWMMAKLTRPESIAPAVFSKPAVSFPAKPVTISKVALDALIKKAAESQYVQDVLADGKKLPVAAIKPVDLAPNAAAMNLGKAQAATGLAVLQQANDAQHCLYQGAPYSVGEIVQTDKGWARCTPTLALGDNGHSEYGKATWTLRDSLF